VTLADTASAVASGTGRQSLLRRLLASLPSIGLCLAGSAIWATAMAASAAARLELSGWQTPEAIAAVAAVFATGGALAFPLAFTAAGLFGHRRFEGRMALTLLAFTVVTIGCTALVYALDYRRYYSEWHGDPFTSRWLVEFAYTVAGAFGQFAITGIRMYFPFGFALLLLVSFWFARRTG
jgi:hypothetical protein